MKEDYLWDKTGKDTEIERLETALQAFRYRETAPPILPAKVIPFREKPARKIFPFAIAAAACIAFAGISLGVWLQIFSNRAEVETPLAKVEHSQDEPVFSKPGTDIKTGDLKINEIDKPNQSDERRVRKINKINFVKNPKNESRAQNIKAQKPKVVLTKEEQYAYNQLMLALSITSSKLKMVKDKVEGTDENDIVRENGR